MFTPLGDKRVASQFEYEITLLRKDSYKLRRQAKQEGKRKKRKRRKGKFMQSMHGLELNQEHQTLVLSSTFAQVEFCCIVLKLSMIG